MKLPSLNTRWLLILGIWLALVAASQILLLRYSFARGAASIAPQTIPPRFCSEVEPGRPQLILALHPHCPCSRATLGELKKILTQASGAKNVTVLFYKPAGEPDKWINGTLLDECRQLPCWIKPDPDGRIAASLGCLTSGSVVLYDGGGRLRYQGGITIARGHEGDNTGERSVIEILNGLHPPQESKPVFGCPLQSECAKPHRL